MLCFWNKKLFISLLSHLHCLHRKREMMNNSTPLSLSLSLSFSLFLFILLRSSSMTFSSKSPFIPSIGVAHSSVGSSHRRSLRISHERFHTHRARVSASDCVPPYHHWLPGWSELLKSQSPHELNTFWLVVCHVWNSKVFVVFSFNWYRQITIEALLTEEC